MPVSHECQCLFLHSQLSVRYPDAAESCLQDPFFAQIERKKEAGMQWIRRHLPSWLVRFGSLNGVWHMWALFGGLVPALLKKVLSAGECGVKPRGFGLRIFLSPLCLFHQHMCSVKPWPSRISPPGLMWSHTSALWVLECCCWGNATRDTISPQHPHNKCGCVWMYAASGVVVCCWLLLHAHSLLQSLLHSVPSCNPIVVCICMLTCAYTLLLNTGIHVFVISAPFIQHYHMSPFTASKTMSLINE